MKYLFNPFVWMAITALVFVTLWVTGVKSDNPAAAWAFFPCFIMFILTGIGAFGKLAKKWRR